MKPLYLFLIEKIGLPNATIPSKEGVLTVVYHYNMKVGDRVIYNGGLGRTYSTILGSRKWPDGVKAIVSKINMNGLPNGLPHQVRITQVENDHNTTENLWCWSDEIEIDKEWYREDKLKELGI